MGASPSIHQQTAFALRLSKRVAADVCQNDNLAISPLSFHLALALLAAGAKGPTLDEIVSTLVGPHGDADDLDALGDLVTGFVLAQSSDAYAPEVSCANAVFVDESMTLRPAFQEIVTGKYKSKTEAVDFQTKFDEVTERINSWVESSTNGLIKELIPPGDLSEDTRLVLVNALYFKGAWNKEFDPYRTRDSEFHLLDGSTTVQVPCMTTGRDQFLCSNDGFKVLRLPYMRREDERQFSMYIFLPDARDGIWRLQEELISSAHDESLTGLLPMHEVVVGEFKLPKFKISYGFEASDVLKDLGVVSAFVDGVADLSAMAEFDPLGGKLYVAHAHHKASIEVDEAGTEAAAATDEDIGMGCCLREEDEPEPVPMDFVADHPFLFFITEDTTGLVLFAGHVTNPLEMGVLF